MCRCAVGLTAAMMNPRLFQTVVGAVCVLVAAAIHFLFFYIDGSAALRAQLHGMDAELASVLLCIAVIAKDASVRREDLGWHKHRHKATHVHLG